MIQKLINKKSLTVIGINSGTSADSLDLAAVRVLNKKSGISVRFLKGKTVPYPRLFSDKLQKAVLNRSLSLEEAMFLDRELGNFIGRQTCRFSADLKKINVVAHLVASHGQTLRHLPGRFKISRRTSHATMQIGHPETIAFHTGLPTVADFRQADIAAGGEGAPITSLAMWHLFSDKKRNRLLLNIGGIANYFFFPAGTGPDHIIARDCGPGNSLMDLLANKFFGRPYDAMGRLAAKGRISQRLLTILMADDYLKGKFGPSTGRERFGEKFVEKIIRWSAKLNLNRYDIMATTAELTAVTIVDHIRRLLGQYDINSLHLFGGGAKNKFIVDGLKLGLPEIDIETVERLGYEGDYLEAVCYAVMGAMTLWRQTGNLPDVTGAQKKVVCGKIIDIFE